MDEQSESSRRVGKGPEESQKEESQKWNRRLNNTLLAVCDFYHWWRDGRFHVGSLSADSRFLGATTIVSFELGPAW